MTLYEEQEGRLGHLSPSTAEIWSLKIETNDAPILICELSSRVLVCELFWTDGGTLISPHIPWAVPRQMLSKRRKRKVLPGRFIKPTHCSCGTLENKNPGHGH
jgi:hypothetical protein